MRKETVSLALGITGRFGGASRGFVVAALNAASAFCRGSAGRRGRSKDILGHPWSRAVVGTMASVAELLESNEVSNIARRKLGFADKRSAMAAIWVPGFACGPWAE